MKSTVKGKILLIPGLLILLVSLALVGGVSVFASHTHGIQVVQATGTGTPSTASVSWVTNNAASTVNKLRVRLDDTEKSGATTTVPVTNTTFTGAGSSIAAFELTRRVGELTNGSATTTNSIKFIGEVEIVSSATTGKIFASHGDTVKTTYKASNHVIGTAASVKVDGSGPTVGSLTPATATSQKSDDVNFVFDVVDADSGIGTTGTGATLRPADSSIKFIITTSGGTQTVTGGFLKYTAITNGWRVTAETVDIGEGSVTWRVEATDVAGNKTRTDRDTTTSCNAYSPGSTCEEFALTIDKTAPALSTAETGKAYDSTNKKVIVARNSIMTKFVKTGTANDDFLSGGSIQASDFLVEGATITGIVFPNLKAADTGDATEMRNIVFLTLAADLAPTAKPKVRVVSGIQDLAGNEQSSGEVTAADKIAPAFTVTITGDAAARPVASGASTSKAITIRVVADEELTIDGIKLLISQPSPSTTSPFAWVAASGDIVEVTATKVTGSARTYEAKRVIGDNPGSGSRLLNVYVKGTGLSGQNLGTSGSGGANGAAVDLTKAHLVEYDSALPAPSLALTPAVTGTTDKTESKRPFLKIDFSGEATEFSLKGSASSSITVAKTVVDLDSHNAVTLTKVTLDGVDVLASVGSVSANTFLVTPAADLALGDHKLIVNATDAVSNKLAADKTFTFTVVARAAHKISLLPGYNQISFPGDLENDEINTALAGNTSISLVLAYDPADSDGPWLVATRNATTGRLEGTLKRIRGHLGYWVKTSTFDPVSAVLKERLFSALPPSIAVVAGFNLVPVADLQLSACGTTVAAATYFASVTWTVAYHYNPTVNTWSKITSAVGGDLKTCESWWLFATKAGNLVP